MREARAAFKLRSDAVAVTPNGEVIDRIDSADWPLAAQLTSWLIQLHMGTLFGIYSQVALAVLALGLLVVSIAGLWMWWIKPRRSLPELNYPAVLAGWWLLDHRAALWRFAVALFLGDWIVRRVRAPQRGRARPQVRLLALGADLHLGVFPQTVTGNVLIIDLGGDWGIAL